MAGPQTVTYQSGGKTHTATWNGKTYGNDRIYVTVNGRQQFSYAPKTGISAPGRYNVVAPMGADNANAAMKAMGIGPYVGAPAGGGGGASASGGGGGSSGGGGGGGGRSGGSRGA